MDKKTFKEEANKLIDQLEDMVYALPMIDHKDETIKSHIIDRLELVSEAVKDYSER